MPDPMDLKPLILSKWKKITRKTKKKSKHTSAGEYFGSMLAINQIVRKHICILYRKSNSFSATNPLRITETAHVL